MKNRYIMTFLSLMLAFALTFAPIISSYTVIVTAFAGDPMTQSLESNEADTVTAEGSEEQPYDDSAGSDTLGYEEQKDAAEEEMTAEDQEDTNADADTDADANTYVDQGNPEPAESVDPEVPADSDEQQQVDETDSEAVRAEYVFQGNGVKVKAILDDPEAIPDDAELIATPINEGSVQYDYSAYMDALNNGSGSRYDERNTLLYDIAFIRDGVELQPTTGKVSVTFEFLDSQLSDSLGAKKSSDVNVIHLPLTDTLREKYDTTADADNISSDDIIVEEFTKSENSLAVSVRNEKVKFETSAFSVFAYTVDFEYTDPETGKVYTYNLEGAGSITIKELAVILGITNKAEADDFIKNIESVKFSNEELVKVEKTVLKGWVLRSLQPFSSEELLTIIMKDGTVIEVKVTDVQESSSLADFLVNAVITGATQNASGDYVVEAGTEYSIILSFAESSSYQFDNDATLSYQMPAGIIIITEQEGPLKINIVYKGRTYQVDGSYHLGTDGLLTVEFDQSDPDYPRLVESTNVSFRYTYHAQFDSSNNKIHFSDDIERDITFDEPEPGQAYAEKTATYDEATGTFHYTVTVTATGDVTDVNVKDAISGEALIFNDDVSVDVPATRYTVNQAANGFDYTIGSMQNGETITFRYSARVNFNKDSDKDGKITADQTKNTVTVEPEDGEPHSSEYSREIVFRYAVKGTGSEAGTLENGDKLINWKIDYNQLAIASAAGSTVTDRINSVSAAYMKYYGSGITVKVYDHDGNLVDTRNINYEDLTAHSDSSWTYTIPTTDELPYYYEITYQTIVDMSYFISVGVGGDLYNDANGSGSNVHVRPDNGIDVKKSVESFTTEEINWVATLTVPKSGLTLAEVVEYFPSKLQYSFRDSFEDESLVIDGLLPGESYTISSISGAIQPVTADSAQAYIVFYRDEAHTQTGLLPYESERTITIKLTTKVNQEWLEKGYEVGGDIQDHTNTITFNSVPATAKVVFGKPGIEKTGDYLGDGIFRYELLLSDLSDVPVSIKDTFDTGILEVDTNTAGTDREWYHMMIFGGNQYGQSSGRTPVTYTDETDGITITANAVPKQADGSYYPYYRIYYYLKLKDGVDLEQLAIANGGEYDVTNTAKWGDHESEYKYKVKYDFLDKELLNAGQIGGRNRTAQYKITFNSAKATLNGGEPMTMTDVLSDNLSIDYGSINITTDPAGIAVPYSISGGKDDEGHSDGTTVATYTVPDSTKVVITYTAQVRGNGTQKIVNKVSVNGDDETEEDTQDYGDADEGHGAIASFKIVKVDAYDANKKLQGVKFKIFAENENLDFGEKAGYAKEIELETDENGEITFDGEDYTFYFNEVYHVQEVEPLPDYGNIGFDYLVTLTNDMAQVDYGQYVYYFSDSMQIKNKPLEGLVVEKQVESNEAADKERYYTFRISILNDDGTVNTDYNEKNGDDQFENGIVEFQIKDKEQKMFWGFIKGTKYKVEEIDADGFATTVTYNVFDEDGNVTEVKTDEGISHSGELTQEDEVIVFKNLKNNEVGSLKIKKNVTVNGAATTGTSADGTYTFNITGPNSYSSEQTITITNGVSDEVQIDDLVPGTYTVSEDTSKNPDGMALVGDNDVEVEVTANNIEEIPTAEFTNNKTEVGSLKIKKNVTVNGAATTGTSADGTYTFNITGPNSYSSEQTITITNGVSDEVQIDDLVPGTYTVSEDTSKNPDGMALVGENDVEIEVTASNVEEIPTAEFTNNKTEVGSLKIKKNVTVNGQATTSTSADGTYTFEVKDSAGTVKATTTVTITNGVSNEAQVDNLVPGTYTVSEDTSQNPDGMALVGDNDVEVEVTANNIEEIPTAEFTNNKTEVGSLKIKKNVTVNGAATTGTSADGTYTFNITGPNSYSSEQTITITNGVSNEVQIDDLVPGTYTVSEDTSKNPDGMALVGDNGIEVEVTANNIEEIPTAEFTNNKTEVGSLKIKKNVTVNGQATTGTSADGTYTFKVKDANGNVKETIEVTITNGVSNEAQVDNLVPGTYTVSEDTSRNPDGMALVGDNDVEVEVTASNVEEIPTAEFTNNKTEVGSLKIKKNVTVNGQATTGTSADGTYTFKVKDADGNVKETIEITVTNGVSNEAQVDNLVPGTYTVSEDTSQNPDGMALVGDNDVEVEVTANNIEEIPTAEFTNNKTEVGSLKIKKNVTVNGAATTGTSADGTYTFNITGPNSYSSEQTITITNGVSDEVQIDDLVPGTYTVSEDTSKNPDGMALVGENDVEIEVTANNIEEIPTAEFTNNKTEVGSLKIKKNVTVNGAATTGTSADGTYTFNITGPNSYSSEQTITITNGVSDKVQIDDLVPGTYTVSEDTSRNPESMALVGDNDVEIEVTANNIEEIPTAEFTNNKTEVGSLKIKKNVTVNGQATTGTSADGTYTFKVKDADGNVKETIEITVTNGVSNEAQVDNLVPGTYTVSEDTSQNPDGMALVGDNDVEIEVTANNIEEIPTAEFTNNKTEVGSLKIKKNVTVNGQATTSTSADGTYTFEVKDSAGTVKATTTVTITNGVSNEAQVDNLVPGTYTVSEDTSRNPDGMALVGDNDVEIEVTASNVEEIPTAEFTNNKTEVGSLKIKKNVTVNGQATTGTSADGTYTFKVKDADGNVKETIEITVTNGVSNEVQVDNLVPGTYTVSEDTSQNPDGMALVGDNDVEVEVTANNIEEIPTAEFTNNKTEVGSLKIKKNVTVNGQATTGTSADGTYTFKVKDANGNVKETIEITITNGVSNEAQVDNLVPGTYTVSEDTSKNPDGMALVGENGKTVEVTANNTANVPTAEFTNNLKTSYTKGEIKVQKVLKGRKWTDDDEFEFTITGEAGAPMPEDTSILITKDDKDNIVSFGEIIFTKAGKYTYTVKEIEGDDDDITYDTKAHKVTIEVVDDGSGKLVAKGGTALIQTVKITNTYKGKKGVKTGDDSNMLIYLAGMLTAMLGLILMIIRRRADRT